MFRPKLVCVGCQKTPDQLDYSIYKESHQSNDDFVWQEEGTLNRRNGHFLCDLCYVEAGMPTAPGGWTCP